MPPQRSFRAMLFVLASLAFACDIASKYAVFHSLHDNRHYQSDYVLVPGVFKLLTQFSDERNTANGLIGVLRGTQGEYLPHVNHGALFSLGNHYELAANTFFATISGLASIAIVFWSFRRDTATDRVLCIALGLILGGTLGNLFDRVVFRGVRDFLYFHWIEFPVFNFADCCLVCGAILLLMQALWQRQPAPRIRAAA